MYKISIGVAFALLLSGKGAMAACTVPNTLTNGSTADATQVMANFTSITGCAATVANPNFTGNVGIGTASPTLGRVQIDGSGNQSIALNSTNDDSTLWLYYNSALKWRLYNNPSNSHTLTIIDADQNNGVQLPQNANSWSSASDQRLKKNVETLSVLERLGDYRAVSFDWKSNGRHDVGVVAQELYRIFPELVTSGEMSELKSYSLAQKGIWAVDYSKLGAVALAGVKEVNTKVELLSRKIDGQQQTASNAEVSDLRRLIHRQAAELQEMRIQISTLERQARVKTAQK